MNNVRLVRVFFILFILYFVSSKTLNAQKTQSPTEIIDSLMLSGEFFKAETYLEKEVQKLQLEQHQDSLYKYVYYVGKIELNKSNAATASKKIEKFVDDNFLIKKSHEPYSDALIGMVEFYDEIGNYEKSLEITSQALKAIDGAPTATPQDIGKIQYNLAASQLNLGDFANAKLNFRNALTQYQSYPSTSKQILSDGYNAMGAIMWMSSKLDSAKYYYNEAIATIKTAKGDQIKNLQTATVIKSNVSLLEYGQGNIEKAIETQKEVIANYNIVATKTKSENMASKAKEFSRNAISNLAVMYNDAGQVQKAHDLLNMAYMLNENEKEDFDKKSNSILIQLGQSSLSLQNFDDAIEYAQKGLDQFEKSSGRNPYWEANAYHVLAVAHTHKKNKELAKLNYEKAADLFEKTQGNDLDRAFLAFLRDKSAFMADNQNWKDALTTAQKSYDYVLEYGGKDNFIIVKEMLNLAEIHLKSKNYTEVLQWVEKANDYLNSSNSVADKKQKEFDKPKFMLLKSKAAYGLKPIKSIEELEQELKSLDLAISILEKRKEDIYSKEDIAVLMANFQEISEFSKKLSLELFERTKDKTFLDRVLSLNESALYYRIRSRLNFKNNISFVGLPENVLEREQELRQKMTQAISDSKEVNSVFTNDREWSLFLDSIKIEFPEYHKLRYASITRPVDKIRDEIDEGTTVIRYLTIEGSLYAVILTKENTEITKLDNQDIEDSIIKYSTNGLDFAETSEISNLLYKRLWLPFEDLITTKNILIIPNGNLFNLSFESLTAKKTGNFKEFANQCLLSKFNIAYNFSLLLANKNRKPTFFDKGLVAFTPEFSDDMKIKYRTAITDSLFIDKTYLTLLPQPFSKNLVNAVTRELRGDSFFNENASKQVFQTEAKEHKIIHIGTHAEANNISPELSRLVFAKNTADSTKINDNYLYAYEIYNQNLSSNLAILTACETGKPTYQPGEGMISLAHAFNYAGSESILTSLWQIDEQSSTQILKNFYNYLKDGLPKDEALRKSKLDYITNAQGRTAAPQYWAGLVLIGDTSPIELSTSSNLIYWVIGAIFIVILVYFAKVKLRSSN